MRKILPKNAHNVKVRDGTKFLFHFVSLVRASRRESVEYYDRPRRCRRCCRRCLKLKSQHSKVTFVIISYDYINKIFRILLY